MIKNIALYFISVVTIYLILSLINMGTVLLLFQSNAFEVKELKVIVEIVIIGSSSYLVGRRVRKALRKRAFLASILCLSLLIVVAIANLSLDISLEPKWYTFFYAPILVVGYAVGYRSINESK